MRDVAFPLAVAAIVFSGPVLAQDVERVATEVFAAASTGDIPALTALLDAGFDPNYKRGGRSALAHAVLSGRLEAAKLLLSRGADPNTVYEDQDVVGYDRPRALLEIAESTGKASIAALLRASAGSRPTRGGASNRADTPEGAQKVDRPVASPAATRASRWAAPNSFSAEEQVSFTTSGGAEWRSGRVVLVGSGEFTNMYLVEEPNGSRHYVDWNRVTSVSRQPYWTGFFIGDWDINTGIASTFRTDGRDVYHVVSGGMRLPPLRVEANGTYIWSTGSGQLRGRWVPRGDAPGITLLKGDKGSDWTLVNSTTKSTLVTFKTDEVRLSSPVYSRIGHRLGGN